MKKTVLVTSFYNRQVVRLSLNQLSEQVEVILGQEERILTEDEILGRLDGIDAVIAAEEPYNERVFESAPQLAMIARDGVGLDSIDLAAATKYGVIVNNAPVVHESVADLAVGLMIAAVRKIRTGDEGVRAGHWTDRDRYLCPDVNGKTLGLLGLGKIGQAVAKRAKGFSMEVVAYDPYVDKKLAERLDVKLVDLDELFRKSDILSIHAPLTEDTRNIIGPETIAKMKDGAYLVNTSRGGLVDESALYQSLSSGKLSGAGLDVVCGDPPTIDKPLFELENVTFTPHVGSDTVGTFAKVFEMAVTDILLFFSGKSPQHIVNPKVLDHERLSGVE